MVEERELSPEEVAELELMLPEAYRLMGVDLSQVSPVTVVGAVDETVGRLRAESQDAEHAENIAFALGYLLGEQWRVELGWQWRYVKLDDGYEQYGVVSPGRRPVYFAIQDLYSLLTEPDDELNVLLLFNMATADMFDSTVSEDTYYIPMT